MKTLAKILIILLIATAVLCGAGNMFVTVRGRALVIKKLEEFTHKKVTMDYLVFLPPFILQAKNVHVESIGRVESVSFSPSIISLLTGHMVLNQLTLVKPELALEKIVPPASETSAALQACPYPPAAVTNPAAAVVTASKGSQEPKKPKALEYIPVQLAIKHLNIRNGKIGFVDRSICKEGMNIAIKDIIIDVDNLNTYPVSEITNFDFIGMVPWHEGKGEGKIECVGWINLFKRDMQAKLKVTDIDGITFSPYYADWVNLKKTRIQKAKLNFNSNIQALNNEVTADCRLELTEISFKPRSLDEQEQKAEKMANTVLDIFRSLNKGNIVLDFKYNTKMDEPKFNFSDIRMAFEEKISKVKDSPSFQAGEVVKIPGKMIEGTFRSATDLTRAIISGTAGVGKELKNAVTGAFSKEGPMPQPEPKAQEQAAPAAQAPAPQASPAVSQPQTASQPDQQQQQPAQQPAK